MKKANLWYCCPVKYFPLRVAEPKQAYNWLHTFTG